MNVNPEPSISLIALGCSACSHTEVASFGVETVSAQAAQEFFLRMRIAGGHNFAVVFHGLNNELHFLRVAE